MTEFGWMLRGFGIAVFLLLDYWLGAAFWLSGLLLCKWTRRTDGLHSPIRD
jgi:hypothetical protein